MSLSNVGNVSVAVPRAVLMAASILLFAGIASAQPVVNVAAVPPAPVGEETPIIPHNPRATENWQDKPLGQLKASISLNLPESEKLSPLEVARLNQANQFLTSHGSFFSPLGDSRPWLLSTYEWEAPSTRHLPLLFEEPNLERQGYTYGFRTYWCGKEGAVHVPECLQPFVSAAHFFGRVPLIPYNCGVDDPCEPVYTLGVDRPGTPALYRRHYLPLSLKGAIYQAGATVGLLYILP